MHLTSSLCLLLLQRGDEVEKLALWIALAFAGIVLALVVRDDWRRVRSLERRVNARVIGHRERVTNDGKSYAAIYCFVEGEGEYEVVDQVFSGAPYPQVGHFDELTYPEGHPEMARKPRRFLRLIIYAVLLGFIGFLAALAGGWIIF